MAFPTTVNNQITDSVTQSNLEVVGTSPAMSMGNLFQATSQALGNTAHNMSAAQQQAGILAQAATTMGVTTLFSIDTATLSRGTDTVFGQG